MEQDKNLTVWQRLTKTFGPNSLLNQDYPTYKFDKSELLKTTSKQDYEREKLQAQQTFYLGNQWTKIETNLYSQAVYYEPTRLATFYDLESMEFTPEISAALDIYSEESTTVDENGYMLQIYSESKRIKSVLADLFNNVLDINTNLPMWIRNMTKYGDNFVYLKLDPEKGIVGCTQLPNIEIERFERGMAAKNINIEEPVENKGLRFKWKSKDMEFNTWEIAHFRLLGDDRKLPYGTCLKGDTRINTEFGVEEIKDIEIGTKVWSFNIETQEKELSPILDKVMSGTKEVFKVSTKHNYVDASKEHKLLILELDGEFLYKNVCDLKIGDLLVLNKNEKTNRIIPIDKSKPDENKNGWFNSIDVIPDTVTEEFAQLFGFLIGDGWLPKDNDQVVFALGTDKETNEYYISLLEKFSDKQSIRRNNQQVLVNSKLLYTILKRMGFEGKAHEKRIPKWVYEMETEYQKAFVAGLMDADGWATRDQFTIALHIELCNKPLIEDLKILLQRIGYKSGSVRSRLRNPGIIEGRQIQSVRESHMITFYDSYINQMKKYDIKTRKTENFILEPILSIESIGEFETYDIYVENDNHNFYANNIVVHNSMLEKARRVWKQLCVSENTKVWTIDGYKKIKDVKAGEIIYSYDFDNNELISTKVKDCWQSGIKKTFNVRTRYNSIDITDDHQVLVYCDGEYTYKTLGEFKEGDKMIYPELDEYSEVLSITENDDEPVWDLEVESELHNFIANGSVVHNCLAEDAMLIYRTSRAPERRVFKVFVGNMDDKDVEPYVQRVANKFKRDQVVDNATGNVDMRFNQMAVDQDYFIPVRDPAAPSPIDTLPGATNLGEIADIEYIQKKLLTALRVPKAFLGFEEPVGGGKDLSLMDIRFARTINKIQKCALAELNKIAIIHLFLLGFEDELRSFTLNLTNPSSQADLLKIDVWKEKMLLYKDAVTPLQDNFAPVSASWAKKHILGFSDEEIRLDLQQQRIERAVAAELTNTATVITHTGLFDNIDKLYGTKSGSTQAVTATPPPPPGGEMGGDMGLPPMPPPPGPEPGGEAGVTPEGKTRDNLKILVENSNLIEEESYIDLSKARNSLGDIESQLNKLLND